MQSTDELVFVEDYAVQLVPVWVGVIVLLAAGIGLWKLAKIVRAARSK